MQRILLYSVEKKPLAFISFNFYKMIIKHVDIACAHAHVVCVCVRSNHFIRKFNLHNHPSFCHSITPMCDVLFPFTKTNAISATTCTTTNIATTIIAPTITIMVICCYMKTTTTIVIILSPSY